MKILNTNLFAALNIKPAVMQQGIANMFETFGQCGQSGYLSLEHENGKGFYAYAGIIDNSTGERKVIALAGCNSCHDNAYDALAEINAGRPLVPAGKIKNIENVLQSGKLLMIQGVKNELHFWLPTNYRSGAIITDNAQFSCNDAKNFNALIALNLCKMDETVAMLAGTGLNKRAD